MRRVVAEVEAPTASTTRELRTVKFQNKEVEEIDTKVDSKSALRIRKAIKKNSIDTAWLLDRRIN